MGPNFEFSHYHFDVKATPPQNFHFWNSTTWSWSWTIENCNFIILYLFLRNYFGISDQLEHVAYLFRFRLYILFVLGLRGYNNKEGRRHKMKKRERNWSLLLEFFNKFLFFFLLFSTCLFYFLGNQTCVMRRISLSCLDNLIDSEILIWRWRTQKRSSKNMIKLWFSFLFSSLTLWF